MIKLNVSTNQDAFDKAYTGIINQGKPSIKIDENREYRCKYNGTDNTACGVGQLVDSVDDRESMDNFTHPDGSKVSSIATLKSNNVVNTGEIDITLLTAIQQAHDDAAPSCAFIDIFEYYMANVAEQYNLTIPESK